MLGPNKWTTRFLNISITRTNFTRAWLLAIAACTVIIAPIHADDSPPKSDDGKKHTVHWADQQSQGMPLVFSEDFQQGSQRWQTTDDTAWSLSRDGENQVFGLNRQISNYQPKFRSPHNIALIKDIEVSNFVLIFRVKSTNDTGNHRDCCVFFGYQNPTQFYYVHLGAKPDPASGQIMIVDEAARRPLTENKKNVPWDDKWHTVKVVRDSEEGSTEVYFDNMESPHMTVVDKTFTKGQIGLGSFDDMNDFDDVRLYGMQSSETK